MLIPTPPAGEQLRDVCPFCGGGRTREKSFVVVNEGGVLKYICHRASCGKAGIGEPGLTACKAERYVAPWPSTRTPGKSELSVLRDKYHLSDGDLSRLRPLACKDEYGHPRWWYPIFGPHGSTHGGVARTLESIRPKSLTFIEEGYKLGSWYVRDGADTVVLVEDQVSAARLGGHITTVALMGCHLNDTLMLFLAKHTKHLKIALDYDALDKAVKMADKVGPYFHTTQVLAVPKDFKNMTSEELDEYVQNHNLG